MRHGRRQKGFLLEPIAVESYSGYKANESPRAFSYRNRRLIVQEILDRWYEGGMSREEPVVSYFKVLADDGQEHLIRYDAYHDQWTLVQTLPASGGPGREA